MAAAFRASAVGNNGQTATASRVVVTVPGTAVAGDYALIVAEATVGSATMTTPSGWSLLSGPDGASSSSVSWLYGKTLVAGDVGAAVTLTQSTSSRLVAAMQVFSGVTPTGLQAAVQTDATAGTTLALPTLASVASGAAVAVFFTAKDTTTTAPTVTLPSGYTSGPTSASAFTASPNVAVRGGYKVTSASGAVGGESATVSQSSVGAGYVIALAASTTSAGVTVTGATAQGTGSADVGEVTVATPPPPVWPPDPYRAAVRNGITVTYTIDATLGGSPVAGAQGLQPLSGTVTDTIAPGVRRTLAVTLPPTPGLYDLLNVPGTRLTVTAHTSVNSVPIADIPMGVFIVNQAKLSTGGGGISLTAPDKWYLIQKAKFIGLGVSQPGARVVDQIVTLVRGALGPSEPVNILTSSQVTVPSQTWDKDRAAAILGLAAGIGCWFYFDRQGVATIADIPTVGGSADWLVDASPSGVLIDLDRETGTTTTFNVVIVSSTAASGNFFNPVTVWDSDPTSPTYAGTDPVNHPELAGPFGVSVYYLDTALPLDPVGARLAGLAVLATTVGQAKTVTLNSAPNPAMDAFQFLDVLPVRERYDIARVAERHVVDTVTHPLDVTQPMQITGRSSRTDSYT